MTDLLPLVDLRDHPNEGCLVSIRDLWILQTTKIKYKKWRRELVSLLIVLRKQRFSSAVVTIIYYLETNVYFLKKQNEYFICAWSCSIERKTNWNGSLYGKEKYTKDTNNKRQVKALRNHKIVKWGFYLVRNSWGLPKCFPNMREVAKLWRIISF